MAKNDIEPRTVSVAEPYALPDGWKWIRFAKCVKWEENERTHKK